MSPRLTLFQEGMKSNCNTSRTVSWIRVIQYMGNSDYIRAVFYTGVPMLTISSIFTETVLYFMVINESTAYLTSAATVPEGPICIRILS
jgi:hypothetical protein